MATQKEKIKARLKKDYYSDLMVLAATQTRIQDNYMEVIINLSDKFSKILRDNGYIKKLEYKPKEFWEKKIEGWQKKSDANKRKLEKYSNLVEKIQNDWADTWVELQIRRYMQYNNRAIFDEIVGDAEAKAERGKSEKES